MDLRDIATGDIVFNIILFGCLPLWLIMGFVDYYCHRRSKIEESTGLKESIYHAVMGVQIGIPIFLGLFFEINVLVFLLMFVALVFHEVVAHNDVKYAKSKREISLLEIHAHSFLETLPFFAVALLICINWPAFCDLVTFNWAGHLNLHYFPKPGVRTEYVVGYVCLLLFADVLPYIDEIIRCLRKGNFFKNTET